MIKRFYRLIDENFEYCYYIETSDPLSVSELKILKWLVAETFEPGKFMDKSLFNGGHKKVIEIGPRLNFETAFSTNAVAICHSCNLTKVTRLERSRRYLIPSDAEVSEFIDTKHDRMTECVYRRPLNNFEIGIKPEEVYLIPLLEESKTGKLAGSRVHGIDALKNFNRKLGLGMDEWDIEFYHNLFVNVLKRNPANVECFQLGQSNSEHSRHWFFKGRLVIDGVPVPKTLMEIIKEPLKANPSNSLIAFNDNSSGIAGFDISTIIQENPGRCSPFRKSELTYHLIFTAETHNFPCGVAPFPGAETGTGGRIRDVQAAGRGGLVVAGTAGYCTGNLNIPGYMIPGEDTGFDYPKNLASPLKIIIDESNGASDYGNKFGEPVIQGFTRTFGMRLTSGERREWVKPVMFTGGIGQINDSHIKKHTPEKGMKIVQVGGPAYRIGIGGGAASSMVQGENRAELDFNAVQRGNAQMEQKMNRVVRACVEMGENNPIMSIHDQGAGGPCNVLTELVEPAGGRIEIREIQVGDKTMSVLEIWGAEYQERNAFLIKPERIDEFREICSREKVNCEVLGEITGNGRIVVHDSSNDSNPVDLNLNEILSNIPQKTFELKSAPKKLKRVEVPENLSAGDLLKLIFKLPSVGSKGFLVRKVDRSVTGLIARQQCCGPLQLPVSDVSVTAQSHFGLTGAAISIGEQPIKVMINPEAGARMAVGEALTNMVWALISGIEHIKCSVNWMWAAKLPGGGSTLYKAAASISKIMKETGIAADGGKDSLSMAARVGRETVKAPDQVVISAYSSMPDITRVITPDIKRPGESRLIFIDPAGGKNRLGGSALAQVLGQAGSSSPDVDDSTLLADSFKAVQKLIKEELILAGHDRSDGGLITALAEMALSGNCGIEIKIPEIREIIPWLFSEELGMVIEYMPRNEDKITGILNKSNIPFMMLGQTRKERRLRIYNGEKVELDTGIPELLSWWESTSDELEKHQMNIGLAKVQSESYDRPGPSYKLSFRPFDTPPEIMKKQDKPKVAIIREEGSNGDREMTSAFFTAGFEPWDVTITDLLDRRVTLNEFRGAVFVGGFSYADVLDSAKGWAGIVKFNPGLKEMFNKFYRRKDTFSLGVCNGCQLMTLLGWVPREGIPEKGQPRFISNPSGRFESRWVSVKILESPSIMLKGMENSILGIWIAHREGRLYCPDPEILSEVSRKGLAPIIYVDDRGNPTKEYPFNPNGSPSGFTALCSPDGRHLAMMPHPERTFLPWQWSWIPEKWKEDLKISPWLKMFQNAREWCEK
ncbi:MAG: phosphoribosylformylglycinamidine synthase [Actinomycetota bacterium]|nr:phosphoribosylformylglycinamidine synthase [Actinomycetota bacterium]